MSVSATLQNLFQKKPHNILCRFIINTEKKFINYFYQKQNIHKLMKESQKSLKGYLGPNLLQMSKGKNKDQPLVDTFKSDVFSLFSTTQARQNFFNTILNK